MSRQFTEKDAIKNLQTYLRAQALVDDSAILVPIDGIFDTQTKNALIDFQLKNNLAPTGVADRTTWELLYAQYLEILDSISLPEAIIPFPSYPKISLKISSPCWFSCGPGPISAGAVDM